MILSNINGRDYIEISVASPASWGHHRNLGFTFTLLPPLELQAGSLTLLTLPSYSASLEVWRKIS